MTSQATLSCPRRPSPLATVAAFVALLSVAGCRSAPAGPPLSRTDLLQLSEDGYSPEVLGLASRHSGLGFTMSADEILRLGEEGLSSEELEAILVADAERRDDIEGRRANVVKGVGRLVPTLGRLAVGFF